MSVYPQPLNWTQPIYNPNNFPSLDDNLTQREGDLRYLIKTGADTDIGPLTLKNPLKLSDGSVSSPSVQFVNSSNMGIYRIGATSLGFSVNGINKLTIDNIQMTTTNQLVIPDGVVGNPSLKFTSSNTGWYSSATDTMDLSLNGIQKMSLNGNYAVFYNRISAPNGSKTDPGIQWNSEVSGLYRPNSGETRFAIGGQDSTGFLSYGLKLYGNISGYTPSLLNCYEETGAITATYTFGVNTKTASFYFTRIGRIVTCHMISAISQSPGGTITSITSDNFIPARFRPVTDRLESFCLVGDGSTFCVFYAEPTTAGALNLYKIGLYSASSLTHTIYPFCITWSLI